MAKSRKLLSGDGWEFVPAGAAVKAEPETEASVPDDRQVVRVGLEKRSRGKVVTALSGFALTAAEAAAVAGELKKHCGAGGRVEKGEIEIQGDHREKVAAFATARGWKVRVCR